MEKGVLGTKMSISIIPGSSLETDAGSKNYLEYSTVCHVMASNGFHRQDQIQPCEIRRHVRSSSNHHSLNVKGPLVARLSEQIEQVVQ